MFQSLTARRPKSTTLQLNGSKFSEFVSQFVGGLFSSNPFSAAKALPNLVESFRKEAYSPEEQTWLLVMTSLLKATEKLVVDVSHELKNISPNDKLQEAFDVETFELDSDFFTSPEEIAPFQSVRESLQSLFLSPNSEMSPSRAKKYSRYLRERFLSELIDEWRRDNALYKELFANLSTPFDCLKARELAWQREKIEVEELSTKSILGEGLSLEMLYVIPRGVYYDDGSEHIVPNLIETLMHWVRDEGETADSVVLISGGPGSGKSSLAKMFCRQASLSGHRVLFIPLHRFEARLDLPTALRKFRPDLFAEELKFAERPTLIVFDGLDELQLQEKTSDLAATANRFLERVMEFANQTENVKILVTGRQPVIESNFHLARHSNAVFHVLPYSIDPHGRHPRDPSGSLAIDQRDEWWNRYTKLLGLETCGGVPRFIAKSSVLTELSCQPLLNHLLALLWRDSPEDSEEANSLEDIYRNLVAKTYGRHHDPSAPRIVKFLSEAEFARLLEVVATTSWRSGSRTVSRRDILGANSEDNWIEELLQGLTGALTEAPFS